MKYKETWPIGIWRKARKEGPCDYLIRDANGAVTRCRNIIRRGDRYFDPMECKPGYAGGFGGYRFCPDHGD